MQEPFLKLVPTEIILYSLKYLDEESLAQFSITCSELNGIARDNQLWLDHCFQNHLTSAIIKALDLQEELTSGTLNAYDFFYHVLNKNSAALKELLCSIQPRHCSLWFASYEQLSAPRLFSKPLPDYPHNLFLTQEIGKKETPNRNKVKNWVVVDVPYDESMLEQLLKQHMIPYTESLTTKPVTSYTIG
ncbi:F-box protein [Legionella fallonii]|uniref:F-box domain-containing protein n=1 Tax=Legionella fallonii LLAP-10 TaxID=1212491 RepID=A0A098G6X1_9GAMM|nr:F-box protein [Legionella fallonii]CEG57240.1 protein of unknown function [F-box domain containing protein] [Legionella fallonii LLAP-10]